VSQARPRPEPLDRPALRAAILRKAEESRSAQERFFADNADGVAQCATALAGAFEKGGRLFVMGNGGSACDAQHVAVEFMHPVLAKRPPFPAISLTADAAFLTAVSNDADFSLVFAEQLRQLGRPGDVALGISTSGQSASVNRALQAAREIQMLTVGFAGRDGGRMPPLCDFCFTVPSFSIHRIQETHGVLLHVLWDLIHISRGEEDLL
jgi:D-sedoheptulose 7-phosphate isomerase